MYTGFKGLIESYNCLIVEMSKIYQIDLNINKNQTNQVPNCMGQQAAPLLKRT